jgi:hypothetical protein
VAVTLGDVELDDGSCEYGCSGYNNQLPVPQPRYLSETRCLFQVYLGLVNGWLAGTGGTDNEIESRSLKSQRLRR